MDKLVADTIRTIRAERPYVTMREASERARRRVAQGKGARYGFHKPANPYNPPFEAYGETNLRWIESTKRAGLRFVGFADEIAKEFGSRSIDHTGWYSDALQTETLRGAVYQLPGRDGRALYVYGYNDPVNDGAALLCFGAVPGEQLESCYDQDAAKLEAARFADQLAEAAAEEAREYDEAWQAANRWAELGEAMRAARTKARQLVADMRAARKAGQEAAASICEALRAQVRALIEEWEEAHRQREKLEDEFFYCSPSGERKNIGEFAQSNL